MEEIKIFNQEEILHWVNLFDPPSNTQEYIRWNFIENYGSAPLVGAVSPEKNLVIGAKPGWTEPLVYNSEKHKVIQFRHTIVHPDFRRMGIFSKMTSFYINKAKAENYEFIFNVSVPNSKAGYIKMGWKYIEGYQRLVKIFPFRILSKYFNSGNLFSETSRQKYSIDKYWEFIAGMNQKTKEDFINKYHINKSLEYIKWRYSKPSKEYYCCADEKLGYVLFCFEMKKKFRILYIGDMRLLGNYSSSFRTLLKRIKKDMCFEMSSLLVSVGHPYYNIFRQNGYRVLRKNLNFGIKQLTMPDEEFHGKLSDMRNWAFLSGDIDTY